MYMLMDIYTCMYTQSIMASIYIYVDRYSYQDLCHLPFGPARSAAARRKSAHAKSTTLDALLPPGRLGLYRYIHKCVTERFIYSAISLSYRACLYVYIYMYIRCLTCIHIYMCEGIYTLIYIHAHTHTHTFSSKVYVFYICIYIYTFVACRHESGFGVYDIRRPLDRGRGSTEKCLGRQRSQRHEALLHVPKRCVPFLRPAHHRRNRHFGEPRVPPQEGNGAAHGHQYVGCCEAPCPVPTLDEQGHI